MKFEELEKLIKNSIVFEFPLPLAIFHVFRGPPKTPKKAKKRLKSRNFDVFPKKAGEISVGIWVTPLPLPAKRILRA